MKISSINTAQNFGAKKTAAYDKTNRRITATSAVLIPAIMIGAGYAVSDTDHYESKKALHDNNISVIPYKEYENILDKTAIKDLKLIKLGENQFEFSAKSKFFDELHGTMKKSEMPWSLSGTFRKEGLFTTENYNYKIRKFPQKSYDEHYTFLLELGKNKDDMKQYIIRKEKDSDDIYVNGKRLHGNEERRAGNVSLVLFLMTIAGIYNIARKQ